MSTPKKLLVTGALGFIARNFVDSAPSHPEWQLVLTDRARPNDPGARLDFQLDVTHSEALSEAVREVDAVMHLAAETNNDISLREPDRFLQSNIIGTFNLIQACVKHDKRVHLVSTDEVFGDLDFESESRFTIDSPYMPSSPYSATKASADLLARAWMRSFGLKATISNCTNNFGPYQDSGKLIPRTIQLAIGGKRPQVYGNGRHVRDWIHVSDHVQGLWLALERGRIGQTYLFSGESPRSSLQVTQEILRQLGLPTEFFDFVADRPGHDRRYALDSALAMQELDWQPSGGSFETRLAETVQWYLTNPWILERPV